MTRREIPEDVETLDEAIAWLDALAVDFEARWATSREQISAKAIRMVLAALNSRTQGGDDGSDS